MSVRPAWATLAEILPYKAPAYLLSAVKILLIFANRFVGQYLLAFRYTFALFLEGRVRLVSWNHFDAKSSSCPRLGLGHHVLVAGLARQSKTTPDPHLCISSDVICLFFLVHLWLFLCLATYVLLSLCHCFFFLNFPGCILGPCLCPSPSPSCPFHRLPFARVQDEERPNVVRLWYCDIGRRGNVPNWAVREKLLDRFLVGGKPVPERVFDVRSNGALSESTNIACSSCRLP